MMQFYSHVYVGCGVWVGMGEAPKERFTTRRRSAVVDDHVMIHDDVYLWTSISDVVMMLNATMVPGIHPIHLLHTTRLPERTIRFVSAVGAAAGSAATFAYSARTAKTSTLTTIMSPEEAQPPASERRRRGSAHKKTRASRSARSRRGSGAASRRPRRAPASRLRGGPTSAAAFANTDDARADALSQGAILDEDVFEIEMERKAAGTKGEPNEDVDDRWNDDRDDDAGSPPDHVQAL